MTGNSSAHPNDPWVEAGAYLFDIDGTLLNATGRAHYNAFAAGIRRAYGIDCTIDGVVWHGNTDIGILRAVLARHNITGADFDSRLPLALEEMRVDLERNRAHLRAECCASIPGLVRGLHQRGKLLGVASGNLESIGWIKLEAAGLREYFSFGAFSDHFERRTEIFGHAVKEARRRLGAQAKICFIGDTPADILAARDNGASIIAVATGIHTAEELATYSPDVCVTCCDDLSAP